MSPFSLNYFLFISIAGVFLLLLLSLLCFINLESLKLKENTSNKCAVNVLISASVRFFNI